MKSTLVILAVTAMRTGVCIAGVRQDAPSVWVRPVREFGTVTLGDIAYPSQAGERRVMRPFDIVEITLDAHRPEPPFVEDWTCDFSRHRPRSAGNAGRGRTACPVAGGIGLARGHLVWP